MNNPEPDLCKPPLHHVSPRTNRIKKGAAIPTRLQWDLDIISSKLNHPHSLDVDESNESRWWTHGIRRIPYDTMSPRQIPLPKHKAQDLPKLTSMTSRSEPIKPSLPRCSSNTYRKLLNHFGIGSKRSTFESKTVEKHLHSHSASQSARKLESISIKELLPVEFFDSLTGHAADVTELSHWIAAELLKAHNDDEGSTGVSYAERIDSICNTAMQRFQDLIPGQRGDLLAHLCNTMREALHQKQHDALVACRHEEQRRRHAQVVDMINDQRMEADALVTEKSHLHERIHEFERTITKKDERIQDLQQRMMNERDKRDDEFLELSEQFRREEEKSTSIQQKLNRVEARMQETKKDRDLTREQLEAAKTELEDTEAKYQAKERELEAITNENSELKDQIKTQLEEEQKLVDELSKCTQDRLSQSSKQPYRDEATSFAQEYSIDISAIPYAVLPLLQSSDWPNFVSRHQMIPRDMLLRQLGIIINEKLNQDHTRGLLKSNLKPKRFSRFLYDYFLTLQGIRDSAEQSLVDLALNTHAYTSNSSRARMFYQIMSGTLSTAAEQFWLFTNQVLRNMASGKLQHMGDNSMGKSWAYLPDVKRIVHRIFDGLSNQVANATIEKITSQITPHDDSADSSSTIDLQSYIDLDDCIEVMFNTWLQQDRELEQQLVQEFQNFAVQQLDYQESKTFTFADFSSILSSISPGISPDKLLSIYSASNQRAHHRAVTIEDYVVIAREYGILSLDVDLQWVDQSDLAEKDASIQTFVIQKQSRMNNKTQNNRQQVVQAENEQINVLRQQLWSIKGQLLEANNSWKRRLRRTEIKYENLIRQTKVDHQQDLNTLREKVTTQMQQQAGKVHAAQEQQINQLRRHMEKKVETMQQMLVQEKIQHRNCLDQLEKISAEAHDQNDQLRVTIRNLSMQLDVSKDQSKTINDEIIGQMQVQVDHLKKAIVLRGREMDAIRQREERLWMEREDLAAHLIIRTQRLQVIQTENTMLRRKNKGLNRYDSIDNRGTSHETQPWLFSQVPAATDLTFSDNFRKR